MTAMSSNGPNFDGCTVAMVTPFRDGAVDIPTLQRAVDWLIDEGVSGLSPAGTTGEAPTLTREEQELVVATVIERAAGRVRVLAGSGSNSTQETVRMTRFAARHGADGALIVVPYYNRPTREGLYAHYATIAESVDVPVVLYNVPSRTGCNLESTTVERLSRLARVVAIKEASGSLDQVSDIINRTKLTVLSGDDSLTLPMLAIGATGVVSVAANLVPRHVVSMIQAFQSGNLARARELHSLLFPLCRALMELAPNPIPIKAALALVRQGNGELRLPMTPLDTRTQETLSVRLSCCGLRVLEAGAGA